MSSISAGTTVNTALVYTADSTGTLQIKTGAGAVTAISIDANQNVGIGTASPNIGASGTAITLLGSGTNRANLELGSTTAVASSVFGQVAGYNGATLATLIQMFGDGATDSGAVKLFTKATGGSITERLQVDSIGNLKFNSGYGSAATAYGCRAWVNFNGTGTVAIRASGNVSSITDRGTGTYTVNLTSALPDTSAAVSGTCSNTSSGKAIVTALSFPSTSAVNFETAPTLAGGVTEDSATITIAVHR